MKLYQWLALALAVGSQWSCSSSTRKAEPAAKLPLQSEMALPAPPPPPAEPAPTAALATDAAPPAVPQFPLATPARRLLIYHAEVRLKTTAMPQAAVRLDSLVRRSGGYVSAATEARENGEWRQETTIRVPPAQFQRVLGGLSGLGTIEEKKLSTDDVTAEHADVAARLVAKRAIERQYLVLLNKAQKIKDMLDVQEKLGEVREDIEATESRLKTLNDEVAYSTITLTLYQPLPQSLPDAPVVSFGSRLVEALYTGWELLVGLVIGVITIWPVVLLAVGGLGLWLRRRARRPPAAAA